MASKLVRQSPHIEPSLLRQSRKAQGWLKDFRKRETAVRSSRSVLDRFDSPDSRLRDLGLMRSRFFQQSESRFQGFGLKDSYSLQHSRMTLPGFRIEEPLIFSTVQNDAPRTEESSIFSTVRNHISRVLTENSFLFSTVRNHASRNLDRRNFPLLAVRFDLLVFWTEEAHPHVRSIGEGFITQVVLHIRLSSHWAVHPSDCLRTSPALS